MKKFWYVAGYLSGFFFVSALVWGGIVWLLCWGLTAIGITTIGGWTITFSWKLVLVVWLIYNILHGIFASLSTSK